MKSSLSFRTRVRVVSPGDGAKLYEADPDEAKALIARGLAVPVEDKWSGYIFAVELTVSLGQLRDHLTPRHRPKGRPRPTLGAASSTGDAGRGLGALLGHRRVLHYGPGIRA